MNFIKPCIASFCLFFTILVPAQERKTYKVASVAFYNVENLFSLEDDPHTVYHDRTPRSDHYYTREVYDAKVANLAKVISEIGRDVTDLPPTVMGFCEIENREVVEDLINHELLRPYNYGIIHYHSPDKRGIDVALIYQKGVFTPTNSESVELLIYNQNNPEYRVYTRDQLVVSGLLDGDETHFIVNHWPSRSGGEARSKPNRIKAAELNLKIMDSLYALDPYAKIISMGDLNDDPNSDSVKKILKTKRKKDAVGLGELYNPMEEMFRKGLGTLAWRDSWNLFDQTILSYGLVSRERDFSGYRYYKAGIFNPPYLANPKGRFKGYPYRAFSNSGFTGGYSDHFPVYVLLVKEME